MASASSVGAEPRLMGPGDKFVDGADTILDCDSDKVLFGVTIEIEAGGIKFADDTEMTTAATGTIGGSTGATDNAVLRANGVGGSTLQSSGLIVDDNADATGLRDLTITGNLTTESVYTGDIALGATIEHTMSTAGTGNYPMAAYRMGSVTHGITSNDITTNDFINIQPYDRTDGGVQISGLSSTALITGLGLTGVIGSDNPQDSIPAILMKAAKKNGASVQNLGAAETVFKLKNNSVDMLTFIGDGTATFTWNAIIQGASLEVGTTTQAGAIEIYDGSNHTTQIKTQGQAADVVYTLPANDGDASQFLQTDGSGTLTWAAASASLKLNEIDNPDGSKTFDLDGQYEIGFTSNEDTNATNIVSIANTTANQTGNVNYLYISSADNRDANCHFINIEDGGGGLFHVDGIEVVVNEGSQNWPDFRCEGATDSSLLVTDANADKVGIGVGIPGAKLEVESSDALNTITLLLDQNDTGTSALLVGQNSGTGDHMQFDTNEFVVSSTGAVSGTGLAFTRASGDMDFTASADGFNFTLGGAAGDDFIVDTSTLVVESDNDRVGIGTTAPAWNFQVEESQNAGTTGQVRNPNGGTAAYAQQIVSNSTNEADSIKLMCMGTAYTTNGAFEQDAGLLLADANLSGGLNIVTRAASDIGFYTGGYAAGNLEMTITSDGKVGINDTTPAQVLSVNGRIEMATWTADGDNAAYQDTATNCIALVTSDRRRKKDIEPIISVLDRIIEVPAVKYKDIDGKNDKVKFGLIAQDIMPYFPEAVFTWSKPAVMAEDENGDMIEIAPAEEVYGIHYDKLPVILWKGIQEQQAMIMQQARAITALERRLSALEE